MGFSNSLKHNSSDPVYRKLENATKSVLYICTVCGEGFDSFDGANACCRGWFCGMCDTLHCDKEDATKCCGDKAYWECGDCGNTFDIEQDAENCCVDDGDDYLEDLGR